MSQNAAARRAQVALREADRLSSAARSGIAPRLRWARIAWARIRVANGRFTPLARVRHLRHPGFGTGDGMSLAKVALDANAFAIRICEGRV